MQFQRIASTALAILLLLIATGVAQEGSAITWESYKEVKIDFGDNLLRVGSDYQTYAYATGAPTGWLSAYPGPEITEITSAITTNVSSTEVSAPNKATASATAFWHLDKDDASGVATLSNAASGTATIVDNYDPTAVAMSWASQSTFLELGEEVSQGTIDWSPGILVRAFGGGFISSRDSVSIHDPVVVWTRDVNGDVSEPTMLFELTAEFDSKTEFHWNEVRAIQTNIDGTPELVTVPNEGPFLDARDDGSGSFSVRFDSNLLPADQRGRLAVEFKDGIVTASTATGAFIGVAPVSVEDEPALDRLPPVDTPAIIESILDGRFALNVDAGGGRVITDVAVCSDGVHISVGAGVDMVQTFTLNPLQRSLVPRVNSDTQPGKLPGPCLGDVREDAELLFGSSYSPAANASLQAESDANPIDRFLRLNVGPDALPQTIVFDQGDNSSPADTRRWTAKFDVRLTELPGPLPVEPIDVVPTEDVVGGVIGNRQPPRADEISTKGAIGEIDAVGQADGAGRTVGVIDSTESAFAIGLVDVATYGAAPAPDGDVTRHEQEVSLFGKTHGIVLTVIDRPAGTIARLAIDGNVIAKADIPPKHRLLSLTDDLWQHFELGLEQQHDGVDIQLNLLSNDGDDVFSVIDTTIPEMKLSRDGYRLAIGSLIDRDVVSHDFDNLMVTFQQAGDVAWDGTINVEDFLLLGRIIGSGRTDSIIDNKLDGRINFRASILDTDLNGRIDFGDLEWIEDRIPNKTPGDTNFDGTVDFSDFLVLSTFFGQSTGLWSRGDFDSNGHVGFEDFLLLSENYGNANHNNTDIQLPQSVPEPMSVTMLLLGVCALGRLRLSRDQRSLR